MAKGEGRGKATLLECCAVCGTAALCCLIVLIALTLIGLGITKIVIGAVYLHDCSLQRLVPIYLIVSGVVPLVFGGFGRTDDSENATLSAGQICGMIGFLFYIAWLICGTFWVYPTFAQVHSTHFHHGSCKRVLINFAFAMVTLDWLFAMFWIFLIIYLLVVRVCKKTPFSFSSLSSTA